ncbi:M48 family metalloprotease [Litorimonas sp. RW-G-Af-16]|uniref:M48 family metalloprotease n=1 Tax=Litorimonas sp. RW-G-Af-16 TaxID=3241168 RepID=UPI003AAF4952
MLRPLIPTFACLAILGCAPSDAAENPDAPTLSAIATRPDNTQFADVLAEYQDLNTRLSRVAAPLRLRNSALCPVTERDPGYITHRLDDYPEPLRDVAKSLLGLSDTGIFIHTVRAGSPAEQADIMAGDRLIAMNDFPVPSEGVAIDSFYNAISRQALAEPSTRITLRTPQGSDYTTTLNAQTACDIPVNVIFSDTVNGHTDGEQVLMTSALMRTVPDDVNLALIVAHEMAHVIAGHQGLPPSQAIELEADRMALVLMTQAGYEIDDAIAYWQAAAHPLRERQDNSSSHPSIKARLDNFNAERKRIRQLQKTNTPLGFN